MIILLYGEDTYRLKQKLDEIIGSYKAKHPNGLDFAFLKKEDLDIDKIKEKTEAVSMFSEKKLIILDGIFEDDNFKEDFFEYAKSKKLKNNQEVIVVLCSFGKLAASRIKPKVNMSEEFSLLNGLGLTNWIKKQVTSKGGKINLEAVHKLAGYVGQDLWQMENEINKLLSFKNNEEIKGEDVDLMVKAKIDANIFKTLDALASHDRKTALKLLHEHLNKGENEIYLLTMFIYQIRNLIKLKGLVEIGLPFYALAKKTGLHPFVVKKSSQALQGFTMDQLKKIYRFLLEIDFKLKIGRIDGPTALDLLVMGV